MKFFLLLLLTHIVSLASANGVIEQLDKNKRDALVKIPEEKQVDAGASVKGRRVRGRRRRRLRTRNINKTKKKKRKFTKTKNKTRR